MFGKTHGSMNRIKIVLDEKGIKQTWLANQIGKSFNTVNGYVQNRKQPRMEILFQIAKILEVNPKDLIDTKNFKTETMAAASGNKNLNQAKLSKDDE